MASATKENSSTENDVLETKQKVQNRAEEKKVKWGEEEFEDEEEVEREPEESDIKTVVEYQNGPEGRIKIIKKVRVYKRQKRVNKKVMERRARWKKFGLVAGKPPGPEPGITILGDEINFVLGQTQDEKKFEDKVKRENYESDIVCHICGKVGHWTKECPYRDQNMNVSLSAGELMQRPGEGGAAKKSDRYVPPAHRRGVSALVDDDYENVPRLRVSNLSEDTTDRDLGELFRPFGPITKIFLPRDKKTGKSKVPPSLDFFSHSLCRFSLVFFWQCSEVFSHSLLVAGICIHHILTQRRCCASDGGHNSFELSAFFSCLLCLMNKLCVLRRRRLPVSGYRSSIFSFVRSVVKEHHSMHFQRLLFLVFSLCVVGLIAQSKKQKPQEFRHHCIHDTLRYEEAKTYQPLKLTPDPNYNRKRFASQTSAPPLHEPIRIFLSPILDNDPYTCYSVGQQVQTGQGPYSCTSQDILTATLKQFLLNIVNDAITILEGTLNVVPMQGNLILGTSNCGAQPPVSVPQEYQTTGVPNADYVLFLTARPIVNMGSDNSVLAYGLSCLANSINRPVAGQINFNPSALNTDPDFYRAQVRIALHELSHALGFTYQKFSQFVQWVNSTTAVPIPPSQTLSVVQSSTLNKQVTYIITPIATSTVQSYFGCSSLPGLELEDGGGPGTAGSHPEKRVFQNEYLTGEATSFPIFSNISLSVFADSGWYQLNYTYVESLVWGRGMGCNFAMNHCVPPNWPSNDGYYCSDTTGLVETCTFDRIGYGICNLVTYNQPLPPQFQYFSNPDLGGIDMLADYCPYMQSNTLCIQSYGTGNSAPGRTLSDITSAGETYCATCRCFSSSLGQPTGLATDNRCYNVTCAAPNDLRVQIGGVWYQCPYGGGSISNVIGFGGSLTCDPQLADTLCLEAPMVPAEQWPVYESISPTEGAPGSQVTITGRNFNLTGSMSVTIGAPCTNVVINSDTQLVATIADASNFGDPIYLTRPQLAVIITDGRGLTDYKTNQYIVDVSLNSNYFAALGQWIKNNPVWFVLILLAFIIPIICLIYCCRKCCCKKKKKPTRGKYRVSVAQNYNHNSAKQQHIAPQSLRPSSTSYPVQEQTLNYDPSNSAPYFTTPAPTAVVAAPPLSPGIPPSSPQPQVDVDSQSDPSEVSVSST